VSLDWEAKKLIVTVNCNFRTKNFEKLFTWRLFFWYNIYANNFKLCLTVSLSWSAQTKHQKNVLMSKAEFKNFFLTV